METPDPSVPEDSLPGDDQATVSDSSDDSAQDVADEKNLQETFVPGDADTGTGDLAEMAKSADEPQDSKPATTISSVGTGDTESARKSKASQLGDFKLLKKLGEGGMGEVYLARQEGLDRKVALKVLSKQLGKKQDFVDRFFREARAMAKLDHPNVVKVYAVEADKGRHYVAIEFDHEEGDLDLELFDDEGELLAWSDSIDDIEEIGGEALQIPEDQISLARTATRCNSLLNSGLDLMNREDQGQGVPRLSRSHR